MSEFEATAVRRILSTPTQVRTDRNPSNREVHRRHPQWRLNVDSGRPLRANSGYSQVAWRTVQIDPTPLFVDAVRAVIMWRFEFIDPAPTCVADWRGPGAGASMEGVDRLLTRAGSAAPQRVRSNRRFQRAPGLSSSSKT